MKIPTIICLTVFLCCYGVQSRDRLQIVNAEQQILNSGTVIFLNFLEKLRNATEKLVRDDQFRKSRITVQRYMKDLREFAESLKKPESTGGSLDNSMTAPQRFVSSAITTFGQVTQEVTKFLFPYVNMYRETLRNGTMVDIWKEVDSYYLPGAPSIYNKPMEFFGYFLAKALVRSQMVNMLEAGVDTVRDIGKIDLSQLHEEAQQVLDQVRNKAIEIKALERQNEKNDLLVSLRTASGVIVFYWDQFLEPTENPLFHEIYLDSMKQWAELSELRNASEKCNVLFKPKTRETIVNWTKEHFNEFFDAASQLYYGAGNKVLGLERFNKSNWAVVKGTVVYTLPVYEKLSEVGFGVTEVNRFLNRLNGITLVLEGRDFSEDRATFLEEATRFVFYILGSVIEEEKANVKDNQLLLPLRVLRTVFLSLWELYFRFDLNIFYEPEIQPYEREWNETKSIIIDELMKTKAFTREQLEEAPNNFIQNIHRILKKLQEYTDLVNADAVDELIKRTLSAFQSWLPRKNKMLLEYLDLLVEERLSKRQCQDCNCCK